jgi:hypothetical protein
LFGVIKVQVSTIITGAVQLIMVDCTRNSVGSI